MSKCISSSNKVWNNIYAHRKVIGSIPKGSEVTIDQQAIKDDVSYYHISQSVNNVTGWTKAIWYQNVVIHSSQQPIRKLYSIDVYSDGAITVNGKKYG